MNLPTVGIAIHKEMEAMNAERKNDELTHELKVGSRLELTVTDSVQDKVVLKEEHEVVAVPEAGVTTRSTDAAAGFKTRMVSQEWFDPELKALNEEEKADTPVARGGEEAAAKLVAEAAKIGVDLAKLAWDVIKGNSAVVDAKATTASVLYRETGGLDYEGAQQGSAAKYIISVRDSLIRSWEPIHAEICCDGTYHATPTREGIPSGYYMPAVHVYASTAKADWPCQISARAQMSEFSNVGHGACDPVVDILNSVDFGWLFQRQHLTLKFRAQGSRGFSLTAVG